MKAILTTIGQDKVGIVAGISAFLAQKKINILDISQTIMENQMQRKAIQKLYEDHFTKDSFFETMDRVMEDLL